MSSAGNPSSSSDPAAVSSPPAPHASIVHGLTMGEELFTESPSDMASEPQIPKIIYAIVENKRGVLHRVSSMFRAKGFNISSISIGSTLDPELARMTIVPKGDQASLALLVKQLQKMIDVIEVGTLTHEGSISRELALVKFETKSSKSKNRILELSNDLGARTVDMSSDSIVVEFSASPEKIDSFVGQASRFGTVKEMVRTGLTALRRGL